MTKRYKNTFRNRVLEHILNTPNSVILRKDIDFLGEPRQISRALKALVEDGELIKLGYGIYAKAEFSNLLDRPIISAGFTIACIEALKRLKVEWEPSQAIKDYNEGRSQQVPAHFEVRLKTRFRRKISHGNNALRLEGMVYAK